VKFLVLTHQTSPVPPDMAMPLLNAMQEWSARHRASGKMTQVWAFAGTPGGGGVLEVDSHEELDEIMTGFPWFPFSKIEVIALSDLDQALASARRTFEQMTAMMGPGAARPNG
jgi:muconolactone D-isomerase